jgi:arsenate reductase
MKKVLLLSAGSPCRAIMAEAILKKYIDKNEEIDFIGAGLEDNNTINENAMKILKEEGIDVNQLNPKVLEDVENTYFDLVLTICSHSKEICPQFPRPAPTIHMEFPIIENENETTCRDLVQKIKQKVKPIILRNIQ